MYGASDHTDTRDAWRVCDLGCVAGTVIWGGAAWYAPAESIKKQHDSCTRSVTHHN